MHILGDCTCALNSLGPPGKFEHCSKGSLTIAIEIHTYVLSKIWKVQRKYSEYCPKGLKYFLLFFCLQSSLIEIPPILQEKLGKHLIVGVLYYPA